MGHIPPILENKILNTIFMCHTKQFKGKVKNTLFNLGTVTYSYERQNIIQFALKSYREGDSAVKKNFVRFSPPFTCSL
jgi:hypothetical protein